MEGTKMICHHCGAYLIIYDGQERWPGGKFEEKLFCPRCNALIMSVRTSTSSSIEEISKEEYFAD